MFSENETPNKLESLIITHIEAMSGMDHGSEEYSAASDQLKTLMEARKIGQETDKIDEEAEKIVQETGKLIEESHKLSAESRAIQDKIEHPWRPSPDQLVAAGTTIVAMVMVIAFEMRGVVTSKSFGWVPKPR